MNLWYVDEEKDDRLLYSKRLKTAVQERVNIIAVPPANTCTEMAKKILEDGSVVSVVIDQCLTDYSDATYTGLQLAGEIRKYDPKIPIYILTNHADLTPDEWEIEYVFSKEDFADPIKKKAISERIQRHISIYFDVSDGIQKRFQELLRKSISSTLSEVELSELGLLDYYRTATVLIDEAPLASKLSKGLDSQEKALNELRSEIEGMAES